MSQTWSAPPSIRAASLPWTTHVRQVSGRFCNRGASDTSSLPLCLSVSLARTRASGSAARPSHRRGRFTPMRAIPRPGRPPASPGRCISPGSASQPTRMRCCCPSSPFAWRLVAQHLPAGHRPRRDHRHRPLPPDAGDLSDRWPAHRAVEQARPRPTFLGRLELKAARRSPVRAIRVLRPITTETRIPDRKRGYPGGGAGECFSRRAGAPWRPRVWSNELPTWLGRSVANITAGRIRESSGERFPRCSRRGAQVGAVCAGLAVLRMFACWSRGPSRRCGSSRIASRARVVGWRYVSSWTRCSCAQSVICASAGSSALPRSVRA